MKTLRLPYIVLICTIAIQLAMPYSVLADDATPPPPDVATEVQPIETEQPAVDVVPAATEQLPVAGSTEEAPSPEVVITESNQPDSLLEALPENAELVVLDENNQPMPLATEAAADAIANSDPWWCPDGTTPTSGGCSSYLTFTSLISGLHSIGAPTNGTVYVQQGLYGGPETSITLDGNYLPNVGNLILIGGWDLAAATPSQTGNTIFNVPFSILNWTHDISVQDIQINGSTWNGLTINTTGQASLEDVIANNNVHDGIRITAGNSITLNNVQANYNGDDGIDISSTTNTGAISLNQIQTNHNGDDGIHIYTNQKSSIDPLSGYYRTSINLTGITSDFNGGDGLDLISPLEAANCTYSEHFIPAGQTEDWWPIANIQGPTLFVARHCTEPHNESLGIYNSEFNNNGANGMFISTAASSLEIGGNPYNANPLSINANGNGQNGVFIDIFASAPPTFPWAGYMAHAEALAGGPATIIAYGSGGETFPLFGSIITNDNQGQGFYYHTDSPGTWCRYTPFGAECASPPSLVPIVGGEQINLGGNENPNDDEKPADTGSNTVITNSGSESKGSSEAGSGNSLCAQNSISILQLPSGNNLRVYCPISGTLSVKDQTRKGLPGALPAGMSFVSGMEVTLSQDDTPTEVITDSGHLEPSFVTPADQAGNNLVILFWDPSTNNWVELPAFGAEGTASLKNGGTILEGVHTHDNIAQSEISVNFPGIFVLAVK